MIAVADADDSVHARALTVRDRLRKESRQLVTTDAVVIEVANTLSRQRLRHIAVATIDALRLSVAQGEIEIVHVDEDLIERGWQLYRQRPDKEWGLTDCISFVVMGERSIYEAFTTDHHFEQAGFVRLLKV